MEDKKTFGEYISKKRREVGLTQKEFSEKLFVSESEISKWERGLSYPDITLVRDICEILSISEHELMTASEDVEARKSEKLAQKYVSFVKQYRIILSTIYGLSLLICLICNIAVEHKLSWFFIVLTSEMVAMSLTLTPVLIPRKKGIATLVIFTISLSILLMACCLYTGGNYFFVVFVALLLGLTLIFLPYVLQSINLHEFLCNKKTLIYFLTETILLFMLLVVTELYTGGGWLLDTGLPITIFYLSLLWGMMFIIRYLKINKFFRVAGCSALVGTYGYFHQGFLSFILKDNINGIGFKFNFTNWSEDTLNGNVNMVVIFVLLILIVTFTVMGTLVHVKKGRNV